MKLSDLHFHLPAEQIAQFPVPERDQSRLLVVHRDSGRLEHRRFAHVPEYLSADDALVVNRTRVMAARLRGRREPGGGQVELLLIRPQGELWLTLGRPGRRLRPGLRLSFAAGRLRATVASRCADGRFLIRFDVDDLPAALESCGHVPLPPYIHREANALDGQRYQTVYASEQGAVAAPTAGLHFTRTLLNEISGRGTAVVQALLHVGPGTFEPIRCEDPTQHRLEPEYCELGADAASIIRDRRQRGGRTVAVGTTVVRTLETAAEETGCVRAFSGMSGKFIYPPYDFTAVDALITNFHLPGSTLLLLVAAFVGQERLLDIYAEAVAAGYRFYSYGDSMLIL